jgi:hypothetical protein
MHKLRAMTFSIFVLAQASAISAQQDSARNVQVATIRWYLDTKLLTQGGTSLVVCLSYGAERLAGGRSGPMESTTDLDSATIAQIHRATIALRPGSACEVPVQPTIERVTGHAAIAVTVGSPTFNSAGRAIIYVQSHTHGRSASGYECHAIRRDAGWVIETCSGTWIA